MSLPNYSETLQSVNCKKLNNFHDTSAEMAYQRYVGWTNTSSQDANLNYLYSPENLLELQVVIKNSLKGVHPEGKDIIVSTNQIAEVLSNVYENGTRTGIGDIYSRYIIEQEKPRCDIRTLNNQTVQAIVNQIKTEFEVQENNKKLTIWTSVYGDFNKEGLRAHPPIKIRKKHPQYMAFNMNY
jgi:hypothetical protein